MRDFGDMRPDRAALRFGFAAIAVAAFAAMLALTAAAPQVMERPLIGSVPTSLVIAAAMIGLAVALTGVYVLIADREPR